jgi:uncharacterized protein (DUF488 family)
MQQMTIYTVGHSNHPMVDFVALLLQHEIETLVDVRSQPYSRRHPQFNRESLATSLEAAGIRYVDLGKSLGGRPEQADLYDPGSERPDYERQRETPLYRQGLAQLCEIAQGAKTAMMCSEGDPEQCHRTLLVTPDLLEAGHNVQHILRDGRLRQAEIKPRQLGFGF